MSAYRDLTVQFSLPVVDGCVALPDNADAVLFVMVDGNPTPVRSLWHDFKNVGMNTDAGFAFGLIDAGFWPTYRQLTDTIYSLFIVPATDSVANTTFNLAGAYSISVRGNDGTTTRYATTTGGLLSYWVTSPYGSAPLLQLPAATAAGILYTTTGNGDTPTSASPVPYFTAQLVEGPAVTYTWTFYDYDASRTPTQYKWAGVNGANGVITTAGPFTPVSFNGYISTANLTIVAYPALIFKDGITSIDSIQFASLPDNFELRTDPTDPETAVASLSKGSGVTRYRRYRLNRSVDGSTIVHVLCKRAFIPLVDGTDIVYVNNIGALKHGLLARIAEDGADIERAEYHWSKCVMLLEEEAASTRGAAMPRLNFDPYGTGGRSLIPTVL